MATERALLVQLVDMINSGRIVLPTLAEVAIEVRDITQRADCNLADLGNVVSKDPALSATLIRWANSPVLGGLVRADSVTAAVMRLGLERTRDLALASAMHQMFYADRDMSWKALERIRNNNIDVASCALAVLASEQQQNRLTDLSADTLMLACQVHNIGALALIDQAERHPHLFQDEAQLDRMIDILCPQLSKAVLNEWRFAEDLVEVARYWRDFSYQTPTVSYLDLVRLAALYTRKIKLADPFSSTLELFVRKRVISNIDLFAEETYFITFNQVRDEMLSQ